jgi:hypothetical protein
MQRREFLTTCGFLAAGTLSRGQRSAAGAKTNAGREITSDIVIVGGGLGGCAAAFAAARLGARVVLSEPTEWVGGQLTQQAVPPDEHRWIESFGCTASYRRFRNLVRDYYRGHYPLTGSARAVENLNPGNGSVSRLCHEPRVALAVLEAMLAPYVSSGRLTLLLDTQPIRAEVAGDRIRAIILKNVYDGSERAIIAPYFIDASELGDLLPLAGVEYVTGAESQEQTGEPHAPSEPDPQNIQAFTWCFAVDYLEGEDHTIEKPARYDFWRQYTPEMSPPWPGRLLDWAYTHPPTLQPRELSFAPSAKGKPDPQTPTLNLWKYRRIIDHRNFEGESYASDITIVNWPQNDYFRGSIFDVGEEEKQRHLDEARQLSLSLLYWLQTEAPRPDGKQGWPGLRLRNDVVGTADGLAKFPYVREARRIRAEFTVLQQHIWPPARMKAAGGGRDAATAAPFDDSVGVGHYVLDLHPSTGGDNYIDLPCLPFQIPLGALIPQRMENLLPGCKNLGTTHITNGSYRLHPVEWNIGEAAGALAAFCLKRGEPPRHVRNQAALLQDFQSLLVKQGFELDWSKLRS